MSKEQMATNFSNETRTNLTEDLLANTLPARTGPYRSLSAKRPRDPSHRKSVSFNDVPIVHEVPSHDAMRNSNCDTYRSWTYTDATPPTSVIPSFYATQVFSPYNSTNTTTTATATGQKLQLNNRLNSTLYSTPSTNITPSTTTTTTTTTATIPTRIPDWAIRGKTPKTTSTVDESNHSNENNTTWIPPVIVIQTPEEKLNKDTTHKYHNHSIYSSLHATHSHQHFTPSGTSSLANNSENNEEKKFSYRSALIPDTEHHRSLPFTYGPLSDSTATYTSMLSTNLIHSNHSSNEQSTSGHLRTARARSATLPSSANHNSQRINDTVSITPFRATTTTTTPLPNSSNTATRTILRPTTIAFQCSQPSTTTTTTAATINTNNSSPPVITTTATNNYNTINPSLASTTNTITSNTNTTKTPNSPARLGSAATAAAAATHSRFVLPPHRAFTTASLTSSAIKYAFGHPTTDTILSNHTTQHPITPKPPATALPRSRSAHVLSTRRAAASPVVVLDGQTNGNTTASSAHAANNNLYATAKRNPNVRQTYGSYYMHRVLLPTTIN